MFQALALALIVAMTGLPTGGANILDLGLALTESPPPLCSDAGAPLLLSGTGRDGGYTESTCTADCDPYTDVSCTGTSCSAQNRNCGAGQRGWVECDGNYTYCPACPAGCTEGAYQFDGTGNCCSEGREETDIYKCIGGQWVYQRTRCFPSPECPWLP